MFAFCAVVTGLFFFFFGRLCRADRLKKTTSERQMRRVSSLDVPACVVVKRGDATEKEVILQVRRDKKQKELRDVCTTSGGCNSD